MSLENKFNYATFIVFFCFFADRTVLSRFISLPVSFTLIGQFEDNYCTALPPLDRYEDQRVVPPRSREDVPRFRATRDEQRVGIKPGDTRLPGGEETNGSNNSTFHEGELGSWAHLTKTRRDNGAT